ncbi:EboA domain-containing protein [Streptomyces paludis]|uniref:Sugar phosphate isomerase n=1 Tax=Streptomyces paludis TaxID=2282738 RepID=A0A345HX10_9ACTN|nr:EboA domain-containing protein [Streptomyces paludis]AXG81234.1 sugar phosphate isomerase [Streptomyces paludis]
MTQDTTTAPTRDTLRGLLDPAAATWLDAALTEAHAHARTPDPAGGAVPPWELRFAAAGRHCGQDHADTVRTLLLDAADADTGTLTRLYQRGSAAERRAVLLALPHRVTGPDALPLIEDALRTHDSRLIAAAVGPYAATHLGAHAWRHAVLKCLFTGVPLDTVAGLARRARGDGELARMLADFAAERTAAGRPVPADLHHASHLTGEEF